MVDVHKTWDIALERLITILSEQYDEELRAAWGIDAERMDAQGFYMPGVSRWYRQAAPSQAQLRALSRHVEGFIGPASESRYSNLRAILGAGQGATVLLPFSISIIFADAPQRDVLDAVQPGQVFGPEEILLKRALRYLGALTSVLTRYGCHHQATADVTPLSDFALGGEIGSQDQDGRTLRGVIISEVLIEQEIIFPPQTPLP